MNDVATPPAGGSLGRIEQGLLDDLMASVDGARFPLDREIIERAFRYAVARHEGQKRKSGEPFVSHPVAVAQIVIELMLDTSSVVAALLHDVIEDTPTTREEIASEFSETVAKLVEGVTNLTRIQFASREQAQIENYRKMVVAMADDYRVILVKLADRMHNMRTLRFLPKQKQIDKAKETLEIYAPIAHRLGVHTVKWELEDLAFQVLYPKKYSELQQLVQQRRADRERMLERVVGDLDQSLKEQGIEANIKGRAKHFYSIFEKMQRKGREFNEIYDLTGLRVLVNDTKDCYGAIGVIHSLWTPLPGRFKDYIAMPKLNGYQSLHTTVVGPEGKPLEIQVRTFDMHSTAEFGIAAHVRYKEQSGQRSIAATPSDWLRNIADWESAAPDSDEFMESLRVDLYADEVYVFTPKGEVRGLAAGATPLDFAYAVHTDVGHRCTGAKVNGKIVPLSYTLKSGDQIEILTSKQPDRGPSRDWMGIATTSRARSKIRQWFAKEQREDLEQKGRDALAQALRSQGIPHVKLQNSTVLASIIRDMGYRKAEEFYVALGGGNIAQRVVVNKILHELKTADVADASSEVALPTPSRSRRRTASGDEYGVRVEGINDSATVAIRMAKCCMPVPGDRILGYISLGQGITVHRDDCPNVKALMKSPERFTPVAWDGETKASFRVEIQVEGFDRIRLLEDISRTISEHGGNIVQHAGVVTDDMVKERFTVELGDVSIMRSMLHALRNIDNVFDAFRVTPN